MNIPKLKAAIIARREVIRQLKQAMIDLRDATNEECDNDLADLIQLQSLNEQDGAEFRDFIAWLGEFRKSS